MPMLCPICGHFEGTKEESCPKCGSAMRYSLLAGVEVESDKTTFRLSTGGPTWNDRWNQVAYAVLWTMVVAAGLAFLALVAIAISPFEPASLAREHRPLFQTIAACVVLLATAIGVRSRLDGVYLAQLVAPLVAVLGATGVCAVRAFIGIPIDWYEWLVIPAAGVLAVPIGLRIGGTIEPDKQVELRPIDSWDRKAKAAEWEIHEPPGQRLQRLMTGWLVGLVLVYALPWLIRFVVGPFLRNPGLLDVVTLRAELLLFGVALASAGMWAGAGSQRGLVQGLLVGALVFGAEQFLTPGSNGHSVFVQGLLAVLLGGVGGVVGRRIFRPYRLFGSSQRISCAPA